MGSVLRIRNDETKPDLKLGHESSSAAARWKPHSQCLKMLRIEEER